MSDLKIGNAAATVPKRVSVKKVVEEPKLKSNPDNTNTNTDSQNDVIHLTDDDILNQFQTMEQIEHIKKLPDTYIGSCKLNYDYKWIVASQNDKGTALESVRKANANANANSANSSSSSSSSINSDDEDDDNDDNNNTHSTTGDISSSNAVSTPDTSTTPNNRIRIVYRKIKYSPGLLHIIEEILVNAYDQKNRMKQKIAQGEKRLKPVSYIKITTDPKTGEISICNDGEGLVVAMHPKNNVYVPHMIFGTLLSSGNYNFDEEKITGGKNGLGAKLTNIFSTKFSVETIDRHRKKKYFQQFENNMSIVGEPVITDISGREEPYTKITFTPDYARFNVPGLEDTLIRLIQKRAHDMYACAGGELKVYFNGELINLKSFSNYMELYLDPNSFTASVKINDRWEIGACLSPNFTFQQVSFVNGITTQRGGKHVDYITGQITKQMIAHIEKKHKVKVKEAVIKNNLMVFVNSIIVNPSFSSQTKEELTTNRSEFGSTCEVPTALVDALVTHSGIVERALAANEFQSKQLLTKTDGKKVEHILDIPKLDDARYAGTKKAQECTLILTEGDSAKGLAVGGISVIPNGTDYFGIFPLRGKVMNIRDMGDDRIAANVEITALKRILGLKEGFEYKDVSTLRYGRIMIMTDADNDGIHIRGLLMNFISNWPSLLRIPGFICILLTPVVKATKGKETLEFYSTFEYKTWQDAHNDGHGWKIKYYKGLGTSTPKEGKEYFKDFKVINYVWDESTDTSIDLAFNKTRQDDRKEWLKAFNPESAFINVSEVKNVTYTEFIYKDLIHFSIADNIRSIPNLMDGLKPGQRKIMYSCFKRNLKDEIKVAQLAGYVSENASYHHGEVSLQGTIVGMAQNYVGSNNINLLRPEGQFGTRLNGGKDYAAARYIFTKLEPITYIIYNSNDAKLLENVVDDGDVVEPTYYSPIIPMVLVNGSEGIGTGWSSCIPPFNPIDIVDNIRSVLHGGSFKEMTPHYRGFTGNIVKKGNLQWVTHGRYNVINDTTVEIVELPIGVWTQKYKEFLEDMIRGGEPSAASSGRGKSATGAKGAASKGRPSTSKTSVSASATGIVETPPLKKIHQAHTDYTVKFILTFEKSILMDLLDEYDPKTGLNKFERVFKLQSSIGVNHTLNFYNDKCQFQSFTNIEGVFMAYFKRRLELYDARRSHMMDELESRLLLLSTRARFIQEVNQGLVKINNVPKVELIANLEARKYNKMFVKKGHPLDGRIILFENIDNSVKDNCTYDFLAKLSVFSLTKENADELLKERDTVNDDLNIIKAHTATTLWEEDLNAFMTQYNKYLIEYADYCGIDPNIVLGKYIKRKDTIDIKKTIRKTSTTA